MKALVTDVLLSEYKELVAEVGCCATDERIVGELITSHDWTEQGARAVLMLARCYGTSILRNALALAAAMGIEDGENGL